MARCCLQVTILFANLHAFLDNSVEWEGMGQRSQYYEEAIHPVVPMSLLQAVVDERVIRDSFHFAGHQIDALRH